MKTAISVPDELFREIERIAKEHHYSRSQVFVMAVKEYLENRKSRSLLAALNQAYEAAEAPEEYRAREESRKRYAKTLRKERY